MPLVTVAPNTSTAVCLSLSAAAFGESATFAIANGADSMKNAALDNHMMKAGD
ncbi:MAG: hypothetical protein HFH72_15680 [Lachnospiraceae bacterium]|nr:hypothetical protein [Lachnospiraceae bacterium]